MKRILGFLRTLSTVIGSIVVFLTLAVLIAGGLRYLQIRLFYRPLPAEHAAEKAAYLDSIRPVEPERAPNIVVIFFDDLGYADLSSYGNRMIRTPRMDAAADAGTRMTAFYSAAAVCTPSRAALLTGRFPVRSRTHQAVFFTEYSPIATLRKMFGAGNEIPSDEIMISEVLERAGYATGMVGKWHLGGIPGHLPNDFGFQSFFGVLWSNDQQPLHLYRDREIEVRDETPMQFAAAFRSEERGVVMQGVDQRLLTRRYTDEAMAFIEANRDRPFFLYLAHSFPHVPHYADPEHAGRSEAGLYGDVVEDLDRSVGRLLDHLDRLDLADDTLVLITSDNGPDYRGSPGPFRGRKGDHYEGGQRVPMIVRWPGRVPAGRVTDAMAMTTDLFPTLVALTGLPLPDDREIDGRDLSALLLGLEESPHELLFYFPITGGVPIGARDERFKYLASTRDRARDGEHLSDLDRDAENHDLRARYPRETERLAAAVRELEARIEENPRGWR